MRDLFKTYKYNYDDCSCARTCRHVYLYMCTHGHYRYRNLYFKVLVSRCESNAAAA